MKRLTYLIFTVLFLSACMGPKFYLKKGNYDLATQKAVKKLRKKPGNEKTIEILKEAYPAANDIDLSRIKFLQQDGSPERWDEIFKRYSTLKQRQRLIKTVLPHKYSLGKINFKIVDYDKEIITAKRNAAEYFYIHGKKLLESNNITNVRQAYYELQNVKEYYPDYKDIDQLIDKAKKLGTNHVKVQVKNYTYFKLPADYLNSFIPVDLNRLNSEWIDYDINSNITYDHSVEIALQKIILSPAHIKDKEYTLSKEIDDGFEYVLDDNGNVMKDSVGNDIKIPKTKTITCLVKETIQHRDVRFQGALIYKDLYKNKVIKEVKFGVDHFFENRFATANGNLNALNEETLRLLDNKPVPIPGDIDMIIMAGERLREIIEDALRDNRKVPK